MKDGGEGWWWWWQVEGVRGEACLGLSYSPGARSLLYLYWSRQVLLLDTGALQTIAHVLLDSHISPFFQVHLSGRSSCYDPCLFESQILPCAQREAVFFVQEHGCITLRLHTLKTQPDQSEGNNKTWEKNKSARVRKCRAK